MNIVKSLHSSLLHKSYQYQGESYFTVSVLWGFNLLTGEPVLEQDLWQSVGDMLGKNELFDTGMPKKNAEVLVHGKCFTKDQQPLKHSSVTVKVGSVSKELFVFGDRYWIKGMGVGWGVTDPVPFTVMPINYKNAFGGEKHSINPLGKGIDEVDGDSGLIVPLPNIEYKSQLISAPGDRPDPASLNRIDIQCEQRISNAGTYDQAYIENRMPGFPDDLNYDYFNDAARDQWSTDFFRGDEAYEIYNMSPDYPIIKGNLPGVYGRCFVNQQLIDEIRFQEIPTQLDTVWFFPETNLGVVIHRGTIKVAEDDASDILQLIIANENLQGEPRTADHYKKELVQRTDPDEAFKYLLNTAPLIPENCQCGFKSMQESGVFPLEMLADKNRENYVEAKKQEVESKLALEIETMKTQLKESGVNSEEIDKLAKKIIDAQSAEPDLSPEMEKINELMEKILPGVKNNSDNLDLSKINLKAMDELKVFMDQMQVEKKNEAKKAVLDQLEDLKNNADSPELESQIKQLESTLESFDLPPVLPRINSNAILAQLKSQFDEMEKQFLVMRSMGVPEEKLLLLQQNTNAEVINQQVSEALDKAKDGYRVGAHHIVQARSPHEGQEQSIREQLIKTYNANTGTSQGDYAFADLSNLDLTGIDLSGAYLEYADLTNSNLTNANLTKAILTHAIIKNTNFSNANLTEANLGAIGLDGAQFIGANLTEATLGKSCISNTVFENCNMAEKMDMFLETKFENARIINSDLRENTFIDADISGCDFSGSNLTESNFINPDMADTKFTNANLSAVTFVNARGKYSKFDNATMKNVRFVGETTLRNADFQYARVSEANFRDCNLQNTNFSECYLFKTDFGGADLKNANLDMAVAVQAQFNKADLTHAHLQRIDLMEGSLYKAILSGAHFTHSNLYAVNMMDCTIGDTDFNGAYLEQTILKDWRPRYG